MTAQQIADELEAFIRSQFMVSNADRSFDRTVDLFDGGYVDSIGLAELLAFIEDRFAVEIPEEDLFSARFASIEGMADIIADHASDTPSAETTGT